MRTPQTEFYQDTAENHRWRLKHGNGKILAASSEGFTSKSNAKRNFKDVRDAMARALMVLSVLAFIVAGCTTQQQRTAFNTLFAVEKVESTTVSQYYTATIKGLADTNGIPQVAKADNEFHKAFLVALDGAQFNTNALAPVALQQEASDVIALVGTFYKGK